MLMHALRKIRARLRSQLFRLDDRYFWALYPLYLKCLRKRPKALRVDGLILFEGDRKIFISQRSRLHWYERGVAWRLEKLADEYGINTLNIMPGDCIVDCGANIGEIGLYYQFQRKRVRYVAFEPSPHEYQACIKNNPNGEVFNVGLWSEPSVMDFYIKSDTADSSLFEIEDYSEIVKIELKPLDDVFSEIQIDSCAILKVEAEGAEPEVLKGASEALKKTKYVVVDAGPERGLSQESTIMEVVPLMLNHGFDFIAFNRARTSCVFKNRNF